MTAEEDQQAAPLSESEIDFGALFNLSNVGMARADAQTGRLLQVNTAFCAITGYTEAELLTRREDDINHPEDRDRDRRRFLALVQGRSNSYEAEKRYQRKDGSIVWVSVTGNVVRSSAGQALRVVFVIHDITEHQQAKAALQASEERFHFITQAVNGLIFDWNLPTQEVYRSKKLYDLVGVWPEDAPPQAEWWHERIHPDDLTRLQPQIAALFASEQQLYQAEYRVRHAAGHWVEVREQVCLVRDDQGQVTRIVGCTVDISGQQAALRQRKQAEMALRRSEERLRVSQELSLDAFTILDCLRDGTGAIVDFVWTYVNPKAAEILQHPTQELIGQRLLKVLPGNRLNSELFDRYVRVVETGESHDLELSYEADGIVGWFRNMAVKLEDGIAIFFTDITPRKRAEAERERLLQALATERAQFEAVLRQMPAGVFIAEAPSGQMVLGNQQAEQIWRHPIVMAAQINDYQEYRGFHPGGRLYRPEEWPLARSLMTGEVVAREEIRFLRGDDTEGVMEASSTPIYNQQGQIISGVVIFQDVTERKQAEEDLRESERRFRRLVESNMFGVAFGRFPGGMHYANDYFLKMVGYTREEIETGQVRWTAITPSEFLALDQRAGVELRAKGVATPFEKEYIRKDGTRVPILIGAALLQEPSDQEEEIICFYIDLTEQKRAEAERERLLHQAQAAREEAETANRIKDEFLAVLSHELRSPLNPILGWSRLLQTRRFDEQGTQQALQTIERNARLQTQLIEDLLDVSRILRGKMALNVCPVNLVSVIEAALETVRLAAEAKRIQIQMVITADPVQISGDSARLQQIVWNLLSNAVKFTAEEGRIQVYLERGDSYAQIRVRDTGKGISPDFLPYVFDYFRQEDGKTTRRFGGLGLGLAIVRHLTELHGGKIQAESPGEGQGATFTVQFPLIMGRAVAETVAPLKGESIDLRQLRILVVDDDADMRTLMQIILEQQGAAVTITGSATEALLVFDQQPPDLLISDIGMPEMDGYSLLRQIRRRSPAQGGGVPAIALTAYAAEYDQKQALDAGFQQHLSKPIEPETLIREIVRLADREYTR